MKYRNLGNSGLKISELSFGSWVTFVNQLKEKEAMECMSYAYERGVNFFDNAEAYASGESEVLMGNILNKLKWDRDTYIVSSKVFWGGELPTQRGLSKKHIHDACNAALKRLRVEYLDLFFCHRPDPETPIGETVYAMNDLMLQGKILYWGTSEWSSKEIKEAFKYAEKFNLRGPSMEQPQYNLLFRDRFEKEYKDIDSKILLEKVVDLIYKQGYKIANIDSTICLERPKISSYIPKMREAIAKCMKTDKHLISIKATTTEKLSFVGREEGVSAYATVLITK